jgi:hypothetical protein
MAMLYAGKDHWGPQFHVDELRVLQTAGGILSNTPHELDVADQPDLRHDYVSYSNMKEIVANWCCQKIEKFHILRPSETHSQHKRKALSLVVQRSKL